MAELITLLGYILAGLAVGILGGLLPALPVYIGPFLLYMFHAGMTPLEMLAFWLTAFIGGQYFGSVATITTNIPGEESALVYINDLKGMSLSEKNQLLYSTALSSSVATFMALGLMWIFISFINLHTLPFLYSVVFQGIIYSLLLISFFAININKWFITLITVIFGLSIAPHANYALPIGWYNWTWLFEGYTLYVIILGTLILPNLFYDKVPEDAYKLEYKAEPIKGFKWWNTIKASAIGFLAGLIPGPSAETGAAAAYRAAGKNTHDKIIAAEAANNSAILASIIPFFMLSIPINNNSILMSGIFDLHGLTMHEAILSPSIFGLSLINAITLILLPIIALYYLLSTHLIDFYVKIMVLLHGRVKFLILAVVAFLVYVDLQTAEVTVLNYFMLLGFFTGIGFILKKLQVSAIPLMFSIILGDRLVWAFIQFTKIYF